MNKFIRDFLHTLLCNSFLSMKILPKFDNEPNQYEIQVEVRDWEKNTY